MTLCECGDLGGGNETGGNVGIIKGKGSRYCEDGVCLAGFVDAT